ncbi:MAG: zinc ribbon domain-containing protein [Kiritimatiellae bacterium]|nr:zinc ribbon domain-containing protein [Kiritimatiellia bacterium]
MPNPEQVACPSCGRPLPAEATVCRCCAASLRTRISTAWIGRGALLLLAIAAIHFTAALTYRPRLADFRDLTAEMNFERVRLAGRVVNVSITQDRYNAPLVRIELEDLATADTPGRQRLSARLEGEAALDFAALQDPPRRGDVIEIAGSLFAGSSYRFVSVNSAQMIKIKSRPADGTREAREDLPATVAELLAEPGRFSNRWIFVAAAEVADAAAAHPIVRIREPGQTNTVLVFGFDGHRLAAGQKVSVRGQFVYFEKMGYWEIKTARGDPRAIEPADGTGGD